MTTTCHKCNGSGRIEKFGHIEHGLCFTCVGTGTTLTAADRRRLTAEKAQKRADAIDRRMAREQGVSLEVMRAYLTGSVKAPKHPNGCSYSVQEFAAWQAGA
jgi:DnaJ-class molecular chaperone